MVHGMVLGLQAVALSGLVALAGCASPGLVQDRDYAVIEPAQPVASAGRIEVIGFYWFGCPHCFDMHRHLQTWRLRQAADVKFVPRPAIFRPGWEAAARLHHALEQLGELDRTTEALFEATQLDQIDLSDEAAVLAWAATQGLDPSRLAAALHSPQVEELMETSRSWPQAYQLRGVPAFVVDGRHLTSNAFTSSPGETLAVLDRLVQQARKERAAAR